MSATLKYNKPTNEYPWCTSKAYLLVTFIDKMDPDEKLLHLLQQRKSSSLRQPFSQRIYSNVIESRRDITIRSENCFEYYYKIDASLFCNLIEFRLNVSSLSLEQNEYLFFFLAFQIVNIFKALKNFYHQSNAHYSTNTNI